MQKTTQGLPSQQRGVLLLLGAAFLFSLMSLQVKAAGRLLPVEMLVLARGVVTLVLSYLLLRRSGVSIWGHDKARLVLRGIFGVIGLACFFTAVTRLPLAEATVIHYLNPLLTALLAAWFLKERLGKIVLGAIGLSLVGTLLVVRPAFLWGQTSALDTLGVLAALGGATFSAAAYVTVRRLTRHDHPHVIVFYFPIVAVPITLPFAISAWVWPNLQGWLLLLGIGVTTQAAQVLLTHGLAIMPAGRGTTVGYVQIVFAALWGMLFFDHMPGSLTVLGALLILSAVAGMLRAGRHSR